MSARDVMPLKHPLYSDLRGNIGVDKDNNRIFEWRRITGEVVFTTPLMAIVDAHEEAFRETGSNPYGNPVAASALRDFTRIIEELETIDTGSDTSHNSASSPERK